MGPMNLFEVNYLRDRIEDQIGTVSAWPKSYRVLITSSHLNFNERFRLTIFLLANRLDPRTIAEWYQGRGMLRDTAARVHVAEIIRSHARGDLGRFEVYVMQATTPSGDAPSEYKFEDGTIIAQGEKQPLIAPSFASYDDSEWAEAFKMLNPSARFRK